MLEVVDNGDPRLVELFTTIFGQAPDAERLAVVRCRGVVEDGRLLAAVAVEEDPMLPGAWYVWLLGVLPDQRQRGFGRALLSDIERQARTAGIIRLRTITYSLYEGMRTMLAKCGWWFAAAIPSERHDGVAEIWLKPLVPKPLPTALIGANPKGRGGEWAAAVHRLPDSLQLVAAVDLDPAARMHWRQAGLNTAERIEDLPDIGIRAAILALPPRHYAPVRQACLKRGWGMLHEKPLGADLAELAEFQRDAQRHPVPLVAGVQRRNHPAYVALKQFINDEPVLSVALKLHLARSPEETPSGHRADLKQTGGGCLLDLGYHAIDLAHFLLDAPLEMIAATLSIRQRPVCCGEREDRAALLGRSGGTWVRLDLSTIATEPVEHIELVGTKHRWTADRSRVCRDSREVYTCPRSWADAECGRLAELAAAIQASPTPIDLWDHLAALSVIEHAYGLAPINGLGKRYA